MQHENTKPSVAAITGISVVAAFLALIASIIAHRKLREAQRKGKWYPKKRWGWFLTWLGLTLVWMVAVPLAIPCFIFLVLFKCLFFKIPVWCCSDVDPQDEEAARQASDTAAATTNGNAPLASTRASATAAPLPRAATASVIANPRPSAAPVSVTEPPPAYKP